MKDYNKLLKPFISKDKSREVLGQAVYKNGKMFATDTYIAVMIEGENSANFPSPEDYPDLTMIKVPSELTVTVNLDFLFKIAKFYKDLNRGLKNQELTITLGDKHTPIKFEQELNKATCLLMPILKNN